MLPGSASPNRLAVVGVAKRVRRRLVDRHRAGAGGGIWLSPGVHLPGLEAPGRGWAGHLLPPGGNDGEPARGRRWACVRRSGSGPGSTVDSGGAIAVSARRRGQRGGPVGRRGSSALSARPASGPAQTHLVEGQPRAVSPLVIRGARLDKHVAEGSTLPGTTPRDPVQTVPAGQSRAAGG